MSDQRNDHDRLCQGREYTCTCGYDAERDATLAAYDAALVKINDIRNSIIGFQTMNWSEHIYPLVAALEEAGIKGAGYPAARTNVGTMLDRTLAAENAIAAKDTELEAAHAESNRLRGLIEEAVRCLDGEPEYHDQGMGCGLEDRGITDRYDAMHHGWEQAMERVYGENIAWAKDALASALNQGASDA